MPSPRRRSARLRGANVPQNSSTRKFQATSNTLGSLIERDETPDAGVQQQSIDNVVASPTSPAVYQQQLSRLSALSTPKTEPRPERGEMHPKIIHQTTTKAPDSGLKLGFVDIPKEPHTSIASFQNTPCKAKSKPPSQHEFNFGKDSELSTEAQKLMDNVREEAAKIKIQMQAEKAIQEGKDNVAENMFDGINASGRRIAKPKSKVGRFSDIHMSQFKKMDSIANHASTYRVKPTSITSNGQSLKRSGSRAGLDEPERPRTAGKNTSRPMTGSSQTQITSAANTSTSASNLPSKRIRHLESQEMSASQPFQSGQISRPSTLSKSLSSTLLSPTKASMAKSSQIPKFSPNKSIPRSHSVKSSRFIENPFQSEKVSSSTLPSAGFTSIGSATEVVKVHKPLPAIPTHEVPQITYPVLPRSKSSTDLGSMSKQKTYNSRLPMFAGLKSILRSARKASGLATTITHSGSPMRPRTANAVFDSPKKVDFTPSVKSRYAVKLAAGSPSPAKIIQPSIEESSSSPAEMFDSAAYLLDDDEDREGTIDLETEIRYPVLPETESTDFSGPVVHTFTQKAMDHNRRESKEFKSIFTTLHHPSRSSSSSTLTTVNSDIIQAHSNTHSDQVMRSPGSTKSSDKYNPTIRHVRDSGVTDIIKPFEDSHVKTVPHGLPGKKRRHESIAENDFIGEDDDAKENRRVSEMPHIPGEWRDSILDEDENQKRPNKRARVTKSDISLTNVKTDPKKPSAAREMAAKNAKERKGKNILSMSRLNVLSRPKQRD